MLLLSAGAVFEEVLVSRIRLHRHHLPPAAMLVSLELSADASTTSAQGGILVALACVWLAFQVHVLWMVMVVCVKVALVGMFCDALENGKRSNS